MGYNTEFKGVLKFKNTVTTECLAELNKFFGEDCRDHPEWGNTELTYIDLRLTKDFKGIEWNDETEKTYELEDKVNLVVDNIKNKFPEFELEGSLLAQGEDIEDRWKLLIENGKAVRKEIAVKGIKIQCPHCDETFFIESEI